MRDIDIPHTPVLLDEVLDSFSSIKKKGGYFVDCTIGYGGHSYALLDIHRDIELVGIDRDIEALEFSAKRLERFGDRVELINGDFVSVFERLNCHPMVGVLADFGVSSLQLDRPWRGFSFDSDILDMRMDRNNPFSAYDVVNGYNRERLEHILKEYGEVHSYRKLADAIIEARDKRAIKSAKELSDIISTVSPKGGRIHPATLPFQAIRIEVNGELNQIKGLLDRLESRAVMGKLGGVVLSLITFHSLEDRLVKNRYRRWSKACICDPHAIRCECSRDHQLGRVLRRKPIVASKEELKRNNRSRSAKLRTFIFKG